MSVLGTHTSVKNLIVLKLNSANMNVYVLVS